MTAARRGDYRTAALYLNTRLRDQAASDLAHHFYVVLDRRLPAREVQINDHPEGSLSDPVNPNQELIGTIDSRNGDVDISMERVDRGKSGSFWLFSTKTLDSVPELYAELDETPVADILPGFLVNTRLAGIVLFEWLAVFVGMPLFWFLAALLGRILSRQIGRMRRHISKNPDLSNPNVMPSPIILLLLAIAIRWMQAKLGLPLLARQFWLMTANILAIAGLAWLLILLNGRVEEYIARTLQTRKITGSISILHLTRRAVDGLIVFAGVLVVLRLFAINPAPALAGLGVGGIAVALAAQKTLENVIAGISLVSDRAVNVGDFLKLGDTLGTVHEIGLRSTRIRTLDRSIISIPNSQIANASVETLSLRDKFFFHPILSLRYGTTSPQIRVVLDSVCRLLEESDRIERDSIRVSFLGFGTSSFEVEVFAYVLAADWSQFLKIKQALLLQIMDRMESAGVQMALPSHRIYMDDASVSAETRAELLQAPSVGGGDS